MTWESQALTLLSASVIRPLVLVVAALIILRVFRVQHPASKHAVWMGVLVGMLALPVVSLVFPHVDVPALPETPSWMSVERKLSPAPRERAQASASSTNTRVPPAPQPAKASVVAESLPAAVTSSAVVVPVLAPAPASGGRFTLPAFRAGTLLVILYFAGLCVVLARQGIGWALALRVTRRARPLQRRVLLESDDVSVPVTVGILRPRVLLPAAWREWTVAKRRAVLAHEFAHIRRRDTLTGFIAQCARRIFWFHPLAWWVCRRVSDLAESACDAAAVDRVHDATGYSRILLEFAEEVNARGYRASLPGLAMAGPSGIGKRIEDVLTLSDRGLRRLVRPSVVLLLVGLPTIYFAAAFGVSGRAEPLLLRELLLGGVPGLPSALFGEEPAPQAALGEKSQIEGIVIDAVTGKPVSGAMVQVWYSEAEPVSTGDDGKFVLADIAPGTHRIMVDKDGYAPARPEGRKTPGNDGIPMTVVAGQPLKDVVIRMIPGGVVTGTVLDTRGDPVEEISVSLIQRVLDYSRGFDSDGPGGYGFSADTNDRGEFRIFGVAAGEYYLHFSSTGPLHEMPGEVHVAGYYPGVDEISKARPIAVKSGEEVRLGVVQMQLAKTVPVHIRIINETGEVPSFRGIQIDDSWTGTSGRSYGGANAIEIPGLTPGTHVIAVDWPVASGAVFGQTTVQVGSDEVTTDLVVRKGASVRGRVTLEGAGSTRPLPNLRVEFEPRSTKNIRIQNLRSRTKDDGTFSINSLPLLDYHLAFNELPPDTYVKSATMDGRDLLAQNARISGDGEIDIVVAPSAGAVEGMVKNARGEKVPGAFVVLLPESDSRGNEHLYRTARSDQDGRFALRGAAPGSYKVFAWLEISGPDYFDAAFMQKFEARGKAVVTTQGKPAKVDVLLADEDGTR